MDEIDLFASKEAATLLNDFGNDLLDNMSPQAAFHAMAAAAVVFGASQLGLKPTADWLRILADEVERRIAVN